jgi:hypothetical protein
MAQKQRVASWYWITTAILTPFVLIATVLWAYYAQQVQTYRAEGAALENQLEKDREAFAPLRDHMLLVAERTGFRMSDPTGRAAEMQGRVSRPSVFQGENERNAPPEKQSPLLKAYLRAEASFYGSSADSPGYVHDYIAAREWLKEFENKLKGYTAYKGYQYYTVRTIQFGGGEGAVVSEGELTRQIGEDGTVPEAALQGARDRRANGEKPADSVMQEPTRITLELVFRKQVQLLRDLVSANLHQYNLLFSDVAGKVKIVDHTGIEVEIDIGYKGEEASLEKIKSRLNLISGRVDDNKDSGLRQLSDAAAVADNLDRATGGRVNNLGTMYVGAQGRIELLQIEFQNAKVTHEGDAQKFEDMIRNLPRIKIPVKLEKSDPDGEVSYSDYRRGIIHIDLGHADGVRAGQRFEIWRLHGFEQDEFVGVVEVVRTLSPHYSLCTVLSLTQDDDHVRKGDKIVSKIWHDRKFLTVALHGTFEPPNQSYTKERLTELLRQSGVKVVDKVQPGTDLVILGSSLLGDEWYRRARNDLRFDTIREEDIRLYVDPR